MESATVNFGNWISPNSLKNLLITLLRISASNVRHQTSGECPSSRILVSAAELVRTRKTWYDARGHKLPQDQPRHRKQEYFGLGMSSAERRAGGLRQ